MINNLVSKDVIVFLQSAISVLKFRNKPVRLCSGVFTPYFLFSNWFFYNKVKSFFILSSLCYEKKDSRHHLSSYWHNFIHILSYFFGVKCLLFLWTLCSLRFDILLDSVVLDVWFVNHYACYNWGVFCYFWVS